MIRRRSGFIKFWHIYMVFSIVLFLNCALWTYSRNIQQGWINVPPVPSQMGALGITMGDKQLAYRYFGLMIQNLGDTGGQVRNLSEYNYEDLGKWFFFLDSFDPQSDFIPLIAGYYFGTSKDKDDLGHVIDFLEVIGARTSGKKWRWLAHAVFLARYQKADLDRALELANKLSVMKLEDDDLPIWAEQMPALIMMQRGEKQAALQFMMSILASEGENLDPTEVMFMRTHICERILDKEAAENFPLCQDNEY